VRLSRACLFLVLVACPTPSRPRPSDADLRSRFAAERVTFERLRDHILADTALPEVRLDSYSWVDPCDTAACAGQPAPAGGLPPSVSRQPCDWPHGCVRWVARPPTPEIIAGLGGISRERAAGYLDGLRRTGTLAVRREGPDHVAFWMHAHGIIPSGSSKSIVWRLAPPPVLVPDTQAAVTQPHGEAWSRILGDWYVELTWN
jgi:hypothetical protein